ncbi:hypothetical protein LMG27174_05205 [Paraburkholderia rhynchosiae]|nr:hypothetical protein LMG27174_05205 [Paraburkholderia rhynchosiae]
MGEQSKIWLSGVALIPYLGIAGLYTLLAEGHDRDFWLSAAVLVGGRVLYAVLDGVVSIVIWRWYVRKRTTDRMHSLFIKNRMPQREYASETLVSYLQRVQTGDDEYPVGVQCAARQLSTLIEQARREGLLSGGRMKHAITDAYNRYTRRSSGQI